MKQTAATQTEPTQKKLPAPNRIRPELNLEKWSIWQPAKSKNPLKPRILQREISLQDGNKIVAKVEIAPTTRGVLTTEDQKTLYALIKHWEEKGRPETPTFFSLKGLAKSLQKRWGSNVIQALTESLIRLRVTAFIWENSYYDKTTGETVEVLDPFNILSDLKIVKRRQDGHVTKEAGYFQFNDFLLNNLLANHTKPLLFEVVVNFKSEVAQLLYVYMDLMMANRTIYERRTKELFDDLGLEGKAYRNASNRKQVLERALKELQGVPITTGMISTAKIEEAKDGKDLKLVVRKTSRGATETLEQTQGDIPQVEEVSRPVKEKDHPTIKGAELVKYFYQVFYGNDKTSITSKAVGQAAQLIARHGYDRARYVVDFAHQAAKETNFKIQTFGGVLQYEARAIAEYDDLLHRQTQQARQKAEEDELRRLEEEHADFCRSAVDAYINEHSGEISERIEAKKRSLMSDRRELYSQWPAETFTEFAHMAVRSDISRDINLPLFTDYYERHRKREEVSPAEPPEEG